MSGRVINSLAFLFVAGTIFLVGKRMFEVDWKSKPADADLMEASSVLNLPSGAYDISSERISKLTFSGVIKSAKSDLSEEDVSKYFIDLADHLGWEMKQGTRTKRGSRLLFCSGEISRDIEILRGSDGGVKIRAGTYWFADKADARSCGSRRPNSQ